MAGPLTDALAVAVVATFTGGVALDVSGRRDLARPAVAGAWLLFAAFWGALVPHYLFEQGSFIEGLLSAAAVPGSVYVGYLLYAGRDTLLTLSRGVAVMGLIYMPVQLYTPLVEVLIQVTTDAAGVTLRLAGYDPGLVAGPELGQDIGVQNGFRFVTGGHAYVTEVVLACTGIGSMAIFGGLVAAVEAPTRRKLKALAVVVPVIYVLNVVRISFIALAHGLQWFRTPSLAGAVAWLMGLPHEEALNRVSWFVADRVVAQSLSVLALVVIALFAVRVLPELVVVFEDVLYVATGNEYDLDGALGGDEVTGEDAAGD